VEFPEFFDAGNGSRRRAVARAAGALFFFEFVTALVAEIVHNSTDAFINTDYGVAFWAVHGVSPLLDLIDNASWWIGRRDDQTSDAGEGYHPICSERGE
jgi:hypothetical protein